MNRKRFVVATLAVVLAAVLGGGIWLERKIRERRRAEGARVAAEAAELAHRAKAQTADGRAALERAVASLRRVDGAPGTQGFAALLVDLAALRASAGDRRGAAVALEEAWEIQGLTSDVRARIARDRGALFALGGDSKQAEAWYARAAALQPSDAGLAARLRLLRPDYVALP